MKIKTLVVLLFPILFFSNCSNNTETNIITGDLIFTSPDFDSDNTDFSDAINEVTQNDKQTNYTHVGIAEFVNDTVWVFHSTPEKGVVRETLNNFLEDAKQAHLYRLKNNQNIIPEIINNAKKYIGQKYDYAFIINDSSQYCSGYIYNITRDFNIFDLEPMSFKNPGTNTYNEFWIEYYNDLGIDIPEGKPGCNPNGMAKSGNIYFVQDITSTRIIH